CGSDKPIIILRPNSYLLYMTSSFTAGELRWMNTNSTSLVNDKIAVTGDSRVFAHNGNFFVVDGGSSTAKLHCFTPERLMGDEDAVKSTNLETGANPYDIAFINDKGYIALYGKTYLQVFDINTCELGNKIDLPATATHAASIKADGNTLLVVAQRLVGFDATQPGLLVRINASTEAKIDEIELKLWNPYSSVLSNGKLYVSAQGAMDAYWEYPGTNVNGIEVVDLSAKTSTILKDGIALSGSASFLTLDEANQVLYVTVDDPDEYEQLVKSVDLSSGTITSIKPDDIWNANMWGNGSLLFDNGSQKLFIGDAIERLNIYDPKTNSLTAVSGSKGAGIMPPYTTMAVVRF
ncbi:MAG: hypothetical protein FWC26_03820, partial [Fibromonadales bacterium]|nr:hypothetical protein [Fibromonadales bacterium]